MYLELQLSADAFGRIIRNRIRALDLARDVQFPNPLGPGTLVLDTITVGESTTVQREKELVPGGGTTVIDAATQHKTCLTSVGSFDDFDAPYVQVRQEMVLAFVDQADLDANGTAPSTPVQRVSIFPVFNVGLTNTGFTQGGGPLTLGYALAYIDLGLLAGSLPESVTTVIDDFVAGITFAPSTVDLSALTPVLGRPVAAINSGFACDPDGTRVALRVDFDVRASPFAVREDFFVQGPDDLLGGTEWAMLIDADVLIQTAQPLIKSALNDQTGLDILSDPVATWDASADTLQVDAAIRLLAVCPGFVDDIDMDVAIRLRAQFSVGADHALNTHYQLDHQLTDGDQIFACVVTGALLYPFVGPVLFATAKIGPIGFLGGIVFGPFVTIGQLLGLLDAAQLESDISTSLGKTCHKVNDSEYECSEQVALPIELVSGHPSHLLLDETRGVAAGAVLGGAIAMADLDLGPVNGIRTTPFEWRVAGRCNANRDGGGSFPIVQTAVVTVDVDAPPRVQLPARVAFARVLSDPGDVFTVDVVGSQVTVSAHVDAAYLAAPYPCVLRLVTTRGVRDLDLGTAADQTPADVAQLADSEHGWRRFCAEIALTTVPFDELFRAPTGPEPPIETFGFDRWMLLRQLTVHELEPGSRLTVSVAGETIATAAPSEQGIAHVAALHETNRPTFDTAVELELSGSQRDVTARPMTQQQIVYARRASIAFDDRVDGLRLTQTASGQQLVAVGRHGESRWDIVLDGIASVTALGPARDGVAGPGAMHGPEADRPTGATSTGLRASGAPGPAGVPGFAGCVLGGNLLVAHDPDTGDLDVFEAVHVGVPQRVVSSADAMSS